MRAIIYILVNISLCNAMQKPQQFSPMQRARTMHTHPTFELFGNMLNQSDRRNLRAADKSIWEVTQMPEGLRKSTTKEQTNCVFLSAIHYAPLSRVESHKLIQWLLDYRKDQQFSCYMKINHNDQFQEYHINPQLIAQNNSDQKTLKVLQHHGFEQKKITGGIFYLPSPLLWACINNDIELVELALNDKKEIKQLIKEGSKYILDCIRVVEQNSNLSDINILDILLTNNTIKEVYMNPQSPNILTIGANEKLESNTQDKPKSHTSKIKKIKKAVNKYI